MHDGGPHRPDTAQAGDQAVVNQTLEARTEARTFGFLGEPRVNVLLVNLDLDARFGPPAGPGAAKGGPPTNLAQ